MKKVNKSKGGLSTKDIKNQYNIYKQVMAQDLPKLCKKYRNNLKTIIVIMKRKTKQPDQPPTWFTKYMDRFRKEIFEYIDNRFATFAKANNLINTNIKK